MEKKKVILGLSSALSVVIQPIEQLRFMVDDDDVIHYVSDSNLLMNSERIRNTIGEENYLNIVRSIQPSRSPYIQKLDDDALISTLKSRYLQSPAEVDAWMNSLEQKYQDMIAEAATRFEDSGSGSGSGSDSDSASGTSSGTSQTE